MFRWQVMLGVGLALVANPGCTGSGEDRPPEDVESGVMRSAPGGSGSRAPRPTPEGSASMMVPRADDTKEARVVLSESEWKDKLTAEQYRVLREKGTERAFSGEYYKTKTPGTYRCAGCGLALFASSAKFDSGTGWPSFSAAVAEGAVSTESDRSLGMVRTEVTCAGCGGHLGHVFDDGPAPTGLRYCVNSVSLELEEGAAPEASS